MTRNAFGAGLLAVAIFPLSVFGGQTGVIRGKVLQSPEGIPLPDVAIAVSPGRPAAHSGADGAFSFPSLPPGRYVLRFQRAGFIGREVAVDLESGETEVLEVFLEPTRLTLHEEITVTAERDPRATFQSPAAVGALTARDFAEQWPRTAPEALPEAAGVWLQKTNHGGGSPFLRGLTGNQVLALVDGIRLNNATYRYGPNQYLNTVDPFTLDRIEILRGFGSTLYGSDAVGGVLNFLSPSPGFSARETEISASARGKLVGGDMEKTGRLDVRFRTPRVGLLGGISRRSFGDLRAGGELGVEAPSGYEETAADLKSLAKLNDNLLLTAAWQSVRQPEVPAYDQVAQRGYARYVFSPQERRLAYVRVQAFSAAPFAREIEATVSWQESDEGREKRKESSDRLQKERDRVRTLGIQFQLRSVPRPEWILTTGCELYADHVRSAAEELDMTTGLSLAKRGLYPDGARALNLAVYHAQSLEVGRFGLKAGLRHNVVAIEAGDDLFGDVDLAPAALAGHFSLLYRLSGGLHAVFNLSRSFRAPNINDLSSFGAFDYGIEVPAPDLKPETGTTLEAGLKSRGKGWASALYLYRTRLRDLIVRIESTYLGSPYYDGDRVYRKANRQSAYVQGFEAEAQGEIGPRWRAVMHLTYTFGHNTDDDEPMRRIPPFNGRARLEYDPGPGFRIAAEWIFAAKQSRLSAGDIADHRIPEGGTPGWQVINLLIQWRPGRFQWTAGLQNVFDEAYRTHGSGIDGPGRCLWTALRWGW
ncbi:MAG: TonB-dependent receptor [Candidatus Aminicenantes bacterium]|nr:TonB-dependent receptor [Candidatus Aminicenantes bacterium]